MFHQLRSTSFWFFGLVVVAAAEPCLGQCLEWDRRFCAPGMDARVEAMATFDDGSGPALFAGGQFTIAGPSVVNHIAKRVGSDWVSVGGGLSIVRALEVLSYQSTPSLFAGTDSGVHRWNGTSWQPFGLNHVRAVARFQSGNGGVLYAGGEFVITSSFPNVTPLNGIAMWNGTEWIALGDGVEGTQTPMVNALAVFDDGSGPALYVGGKFNTANNTPATNIARFDGTSWSSVSTGINGTVNALCVFDAGSGPALYAGGAFSTAGGTSAFRLARWNGSSWSAVSGWATASSVVTLKVLDDGSGPALFAGGDFTQAGNISKYNGTSWSALGGGLDSTVHAIGSFDDGSGAAIWAGGSFLHAAGMNAARVARWNGSSWSAGASGQGIEKDFVDVLGSGDIGSGPRLFAGGEFTTAGTVNANRMAQWDGSSWTPLGGGVAPWYPMALLVHDDGSGPALYVGGPFTAPARCIARWNGTGWSTVGGGVSGGIEQVSALTTFDDGSGPSLFAGGAFTMAGGAPANNVAKWNGSTWSPLGSGTVSDVFFTGTILALEVFDDGSGPALFAGGDFAVAGGVSAHNVAKWNGTSWSALGVGTDQFGYVMDFAVYDYGSGPELYVCGEFTTAGGAPAPGIAKWNGTSWSSVTSGATVNGVSEMVVFDYGPGTALFAQGAFTFPGGGPLQLIAKWNGTAWSAVNGDVSKAGGGAMAIFDDGLDSAPDLYFGGPFTLATPTTPSHLIAELHGCPAYTSYCFGDGLDPVVTAQCPCGNFGDPGHGCANSNPLLGGGHMTATGTVSPNTLLFTCDGIPNNALSTFWRGTTNTAAGSVVHDGIQCLGGTTIRFGTQNAGQIGNPPNTVASGTIGLAPGATRYYQLLYRNPAPGFCPPGTFNFSNGIVVTW